MNFNKKLAALYGSIALIAVLILVVLYQQTSAPTALDVADAEALIPRSYFELFAANLDSPLSHLFMQLLIIIAISRMFGIVFRKLKQPTVVGEMVAGILLGPSLLGVFAPAAFAYIFPANTLDTLKMLSQLGVCLFMFCIGLTLDLNQLRSKARSAIVVSQVGIIVPFLLGTTLAFFLFTRLAAPGATFIAFALFLGIAMSITAFPVLARILQDNGMAESPIGLMALSCAAVEDVTAWCILAFIVAIVQATGVAASFLHLGLVVVYIGFMVVIGRKLLAWHFMKSSGAEETTAASTLALIILLVITSALWAEAIGIHALFGAFIVGLILPKEEKFTKIINFQVENLSAVLLVPLFFVFTGLRTEIGLLDAPLDWVFCLAIILLATLGKLGGCAVAARMSGMNWNESLQLGTLMNTRGLMELIVLNIGLDLGIFSQPLFTMFVIMALVTTILTGPLLNFIRSSENAARAKGAGADSKVVAQ